MASIGGLSSDICIIHMVYYKMRYMILVLQHASKAVIFFAVFLYQCAKFCVFVLGVCSRLICKGVFKVGPRKIYRGYTARQSGRGIALV